MSVSFVLTVGTMVVYGERQLCVDGVWRVLALCCWSMVSVSFVLTAGGVW